LSSILDRVLAAARQLGASDVHLKVGLPPVFRIKGELRTVRDVPPLSPEAIQVFALGMMNEHQREIFETTWDVDLAYATPGGGRYRVNVFQQRGHMGLALRVIPPDVPAFEKLNLPKAVLDLAENERGLVLITGITGAGKSTTLAALVDAINARRACHIVTIEDPIEFAFRDRRSVINQREIGFDTLSFARALRAALRQDPDVIMVGEIRDVETMEIALQAAETGHLVLSTLHTADAVDTVNRIVSLFPPHQQLQARIQLANVLSGIVSQRLMPRADAAGMIPAAEILINTPRIRELLVDPNRERRPALRDDELRSVAEGSGRPQAGQLRGRAGSGDPPRGSGPASPRRPARGRGGRCPRRTNHAGAGGRAFLVRRARPRKRRRHRRLVLGGPAQTVASRGGVRDFPPARRDTSLGGC
jgi:twitching motility protein PilT